ncbi:ice-binding family protein [Flavobacterium frigoris]|uniref:Ig-like domain-containing protein n=1 Tax=Flavobacterium frigoris TaxID=229204 RepID=A0A1H9RM44_FLAFI|nr:ice-binding family protein [Flavobacterium frigoris]SER73764.1 Ig-like domain-containing protein [Flavobacterium frigoris]
MKIKNLLSSCAIVMVVLFTGCSNDDNTQSTPAPTPAPTPTVTSTSPLNSDTNVARNKVVSVDFSIAMDASTINSTTFTVKQAGTTVLGAVSYSGTTAKFVPATVLAANTLYTATLTTGVKSADGKALSANKQWEFTTTANAAVGLAAVSLGSAGNYVILAKTTITNVPTSVITGDLGLSPAATSFITGLSLTDFTGYAKAAQVTGKVFAADMVTPTSSNLTTAVENMITAYNDAAGRPSPDVLNLGAGNIGGQILSPGLYKWTSSVTVPANITISGSADDVWIFQISGDLAMSAATKVTLVGGAKASNIFWQVAGKASFGSTSHFEGIILSKTGITFQTGASFNGRALAQTAVILDGNTVVQPQ